MSNKSLKKAVKRVNKSKEQISEEIKYTEKVTHLKEIVKQIFPVIANVDTIYDAQTVVNALSGFIEAHITNKLNEVKLSEITIDLSKEEESKIKTAIEQLVAMFPDESANELSETLERFGKSLSQYAAHTFMKQPMEILKVEDIVA